MTLHWPQITEISLLSINLLIAAFLDGEPRTGTHKFSIAVVGTAVSVWLLWSGGFFG